MNQPRKLYPHIEYTSDIFIPEIDIELDEFISFNNEHVDSHHLHEDLKDFGAEHVGDSVLITDDSINEEQFEIDEKASQSSDLQKNPLSQNF